MDKKTKKTKKNATRMLKKIKKEMDFFKSKYPWYWMEYDGGSVGPLVNGSAILLVDKIDVGTRVIYHEYTTVYPGRMRI